MSDSWLEALIPPARDQAVWRSLVSHGPMAIETIAAMFHDDFLARESVQRLALGKLATQLPDGRWVALAS